MRSLTNDCLQIRGLNLFVYNNESVSNHLRQKKDFFESTTLDYLRDRHKIQKVIIDAGANIGNHSVYFANFLKYQKIICFEPVPDNFALLTKNLAPYPNIKLYEVALSHQAIKLGMYCNLRNMGSAKIYRGGKLKVNAITLDSLNLKNVTLMKIDVEGHEPLLLEGAKDTINRCHPLILIEDWNHTYQKLLPHYVLEKGWPEHQTYLYRYNSKTI